MEREREEMGGVGGNGEKMRKWRENTDMERERKLRERGNRESERKWKENKKINLRHLSRVSQKS